jgi:hypothetical protein
MLWETDKVGSSQGKEESNQHYLIFVVVVRLHECQNWVTVGGHFIEQGNQSCMNISSD